MKYTFLDKFKNYSLQHRKMFVCFFSFIILSIFFVTFGQSFSTKLSEQKQDFDEIQSLIDEIEKKDAAIQNPLELKEVKKTVKGIDISSWQGDIDFEALKNSGIDFIMIRVGFRNISNDELHEDKNFKYNISQANKYDIPVGVYFYSTAINEYEVLQEATFVLNLIKDYKVIYPVVYDLEAFDTGRLIGVSNQRINYNALIFLDYFKSHGYEGMLYTNKTDLEARWDLTRFEGYKIWYAHYIDEKKFENEYSMWQYADDGRINGIKGYVDLNEAYFSYEVEE